MMSSPLETGLAEKRVCGMLPAQKVAKQQPKIVNITYAYSF